MKDLQTPSRTLSFLVDKVGYSISFPTTGQFLAINAQKSKLSGGYYSELDYNGDNGHYSRLLIDMIAFFNVTCPQLLKDLNVGKIEDLDMIHSRQLFLAYSESVLPWYQEWMKVIASVNQNTEASTSEPTNTNGQ